MELSPTAGGNTPTLWSSHHTPVQDPSELCPFEDCTWIIMAAAIVIPTNWKSSNACQQANEEACGMLSSNRGEWIIDARGWLSRSLCWRTESAHHYSFTYMKCEKYKVVYERWKGNQWLPEGVRVGSRGKEVLKRGQAHFLYKSCVHCFNSDDGFRRYIVVSKPMCAVYCVSLYLNQDGKEKQMSKPTQNMWEFWTDTW